MGLLRAPLLWWAGRPAALRWLLVAAEVASLWASSARSVGSEHVPFWAAALHNSAHVVAYGVLGALLLLALRGRADWRRRDAVLAVALASAYGLVDELHQTMVPGRVCSVTDLVADVAGATLAVGLLRGLRAEPGGEAGVRRAGVRGPVFWAGLAAVVAVLAGTWLPI